jgi:tetratricopeptide (TPR) repeat protein
MQVDVVDSVEALAELRGNWDAVYDTDPEAKFYLSWTWISNWFERIDGSWSVLAARPNADARAYVAFFPLRHQTVMRKDGSFYNNIKMGAADFAGYTGVICRPEHQDAAIPAFAERLKTMNWANLHLENICASQERLRLLLAPFAQADFATEYFERIDKDGVNNNICPFVRLPADWESYLRDNLSSNTRQKIRRLLRRVDSGELRVTHGEPGTVERDLATLLRLWKAQWASHNSEDTMHADAADFRDMFLRCAKASALLLPVLWHGDDPVGALGILIDRAKQSLQFLIAGREQGFESAPPGFILHAHTIRWAIENGFTNYDFLRGNESYKYNFGCEERRIECIRVSTTNNRNIGDRLDPRSIPLVFERAKTLHKTGKADEAARGLRQILKTDPQDAGASEMVVQIEFAKASELHQKEQWSEAEQSYRSVLALDPTYFDAAHMLGILFLQRGQFAAAEAQLNAAIGIDPDVAAAYTNRGAALNGLRRYDEALASYDSAIARRPNYPEAFNNRGNVLRRMKRPQEALASYDKAIRLKPDYFGAYSNRGNVLRDLGRNEEAVANYDRAIALKPDYAEAFNNRGLALRTIIRLDEALASYDRAIALRPNYAEAFNNRGVVLRDLARFDEALASFQKAISLAANYPEALRNRAILLWDLEHRVEPLPPQGPNGRTIVRDYTRNDRAACLALFDCNVPPFYSPTDRPEYERYLDNMPGPYVVIEDEGVVVACGGFARSSDEANGVSLTWGMVARDRQKSGFGQLLLLERLRRIARSDREPLVVNNTNQRAAGFFERFGFKTVKIVKDYTAPGFDLHKMHMPLEAVRRQLALGYPSAKSVPASPVPASGNSIPVA